MGCPQDEMSFKDCELFYAWLFIVINSWLGSKLVYYVSFIIRFLRLRGQVLLLHSRKTVLSSSPPNYLRWIFISLKSPLFEFGKQLLCKQPDLNWQKQGNSGFIIHLPPLDLTIRHISVITPKYQLVFTVAVLLMADGRVYTSTRSVCTQ